MVAGATNSSWFAAVACEISLSLAFYVQMKKSAGIFDGF
jgi:hypothetical protein